LLAVDCWHTARLAAGTNRTRLIYELPFSGVCTVRLAYLRIVATIELNQSGKYTN